MANYRVIIYTRDLILDSASTLSGNNDKRKGLIDRFTLGNIYFKQMAGNTPTYLEMKEWYNEVIAAESLSSSSLLLYVDEKAISSHTADEIETLLSHIETTNMSEVDIFYLANFLDNCSSTEGITSSSNVQISHIDFYRSKAPNGMYAVASTVAKWLSIFDLMAGRKEIKAQARLSSLVLKGNLKAGTTWPRLFTVDINRITENVENFYTYPCRYEPEFGRTVPNTEHMAFYWFLLGLILIVITVWVLVKIAPRNKIYLYKK